MTERALTAAALAAISAGVIRPVLFFEGEYESGGSPAYLRLFTGVGTLEWDGKTWTGGSGLLGISPIRESTSLEAIGFSVRMSGLPADKLSLALQSMRKNKPGKLWLGFFHPDDALAARIDVGYESHWWAAGSTPDGWSMNQDVSGESTFAARTGPSGGSEIVNVCVSKDTPPGDPGADGGWNSPGVFPVDPTQSYLFAVFVKKFTANGIFYWGTYTNAIGTIKTLAGIDDGNPYFVIQSSLPSTDDWYLAVGFVHASGYGGADAGISGVYDMSGVKQQPGNSEYKWQASTSLCNHRAYQYYNQTISTSDEQLMVRPIVIPCAAADASLMIQKIIDMTTRRGLIAHPYALRRGRFDVAPISRQGETMTIEARYEGPLARLLIANERRYTHEDQQLRRPGDKGFDQVPELQDAQDVWGPSVAVPAAGWPRLGGDTWENTSQ